MDQNSVTYQIIIRLIASSFVGILGWLRKKFLIRLNKIDPRMSQLTVVLLLLLWLILNIINFYLYSTEYQSLPLMLLVFVCTSIFLFFFLWKELDQYWQIGLRGSDREIKSGLTYETALSLINNEFSFLGTGASKLTKESIFEDALVRCVSTKPIRFLLSKPTSENLIVAAKRAGRPEEEYRDIVLNSLRMISEIKERRELNISVRFYPEADLYLPIFRLFFVDNSLCLLSYNVYGEGDGSQLPQMHVIKAPEKNRAVDSFYFPLETFYNWLWQLSEEWDFQAYLE